MFNLPNILTISRILLIPLVFSTMYIDYKYIHWIACFIFAVAALTDLLDGWIARSTNQVSSYGRLLDTIADKLLVAATILMLAATSRLSNLGLIPAVLIVCREIIVSGLHSFLAKYNTELKVTKLAKWKAVTQMIALPILIVGKDEITGFDFSHIGEIVLWFAGFLTVITGYDYLKKTTSVIMANEK
ncbi:MAG: CDP-diacylglycerol--glycerol-3-phosphate 3-phosphatidyltransferase [Alphaproteobacteria bacterium]